MGLEILVLVVVVVVVACIVTGPKFDVAYLSDSEVNSKRCFQNALNVHRHLGVVHGLLGWPL